MGFSSASLGLGRLSAAFRVSFGVILRASLMKSATALKICPTLHCVGFLIDCWPPIEDAIQ